MRKAMHGGVIMKAITLRNIPPDLDKAIRKRARGKRVSVNKAVLGLLEEHLSSGKHKRLELHHDLDYLCGSWPQDMAETFDKALAEQRSIDPDVWK
jgi:hypothetical protein